MKFHLVVKGDLDDSLKVEATLGNKKVSGKLTKKGCITSLEGINGGMATLLPQEGMLSEDEEDDLVEGVEALEAGLMDFFRILYGNL